MLQASVVIPTHNRPHFLREALRSVLEQEGVELDVIVVGDGATDETASVAAAFANVRYVRQPQAGPNAARNRAVAMARFDCVALLDDDDLWLPGKLRAQLEILAREPDAAYIFSDFHIVRGDIRLPQSGLRSWGIPEATFEAVLGRPAAVGRNGDEAGSKDAPHYHRVALYRPLLEHPYVLPTTAVFRKSFLTPDVRFVDDDYICGDWEFFARLSRRHPALYMPVETACNRSHEEQGRLTRTPDSIQLQRRLEMLERVWGADPSFQGDATCRAAYLRTQLGYLLTLAKLQLREGRKQDALQSLQRARALDPALPVVLRLARLLVRLPGGAIALRGVDRAMLGARGLLRR